jgi:hypothetical protein
MSSVGTRVDDYMSVSISTATTAPDITTGAWTSFGQVGAVDGVADIYDNVVFFSKVPSSVCVVGGCTRMCVCASTRSRVLGRGGRPEVLFGGGGWQGVAGQCGSLGGQRVLAHSHTHTHAH